MPGRAKAPSIAPEVLAALRERTGNEPLAIGYAALARDVGLPTRGVRTALDKLVKVGAVEVIRGENNRNGNGVSPSVYRIVGELPIERWTKERHRWLERHYADAWNADLVPLINAMPRPSMTAEHILNYANHKGWKKSAALLATRGGPPPRYGVKPKPAKVAKPKPAPIARREAPAPVVKAPAGRNVWGPRQAVFTLSRTVEKCACQGCRRPVVKRWCAEHRAIMQLPAGQIAAALDALA